METAAGDGGPVTAVDPKALVTIAGALDGAGGALFGHSSALQTVPDAGASTQAVATAMMIFATVVAGLSGRIGDLASITEAASSGYVSTDDNAGSQFRSTVP
jgi:hypothetical protein